MTTDLIPQIFDADAETLVPRANFFEEAKATLPQVYLDAPNFMAWLKVTMDRKQYIYDVIRSLVNVYNLNNSDSFTISTPTGVYLEMLASNTNTKFTTGASDSTLIDVINNQITFINSRGTFSDFYKYFTQNNLGTYFNNQNVQEIGNATLKVTMPISSEGIPDPLTALTYDLFRIKSAGIEININLSEPDFFAFRTLSSFSIAPKSKGWGTINSRGIVTGGGFFKKLF